MRGFVLPQEQTNQDGQDGNANDHENDEPRDRLTAGRSALRVSVQWWVVRLRTVGGLENIRRYCVAPQMTSRIRRCSIQLIVLSSHESEQRKMHAGMARAPVFGATRLLRRSLGIQRWLPASGSCANPTSSRSSWSFLTRESSAKRSRSTFSSSLERSFSARTNKSFSSSSTWCSIVP